MAIKFIFYAILYFIVFYVFYKKNIGFFENKDFKTAFIYLGIFILGANIIIDTSWSLNDNLNLYYVIPLAVVFLLIFALIVYITFKRKY